MKLLKIALLLTFVAFINAGFGQTVNNIPIKDINVDYMQIVGTGKLMSNKVTIEIDFGQENDFWKAKDTQVRNKEGELMTFNSMIDALNFFSENGYKFVNAYAITKGNRNVYHYLMEKRKE